MKTRKKSFLYDTVHVCTYTNFTYYYVPAASRVFSATIILLLLLLLPLISQLTNTTSRKNKRKDGSHRQIYYQSSKPLCLVYPFREQSKVVLEIIKYKNDNAWIGLEAMLHRLERHVMVVGKRFFFKPKKWNQESS